MTAHFVLLSDLHLGYDRSVLNSKESKENLGSLVADLCQGEADRLVLNGDIFEACVPADAGKHEVLGLSPLTADESREFFSAILNKVNVRSLVIVWGNHDYPFWRRLAAACKVPSFSNHQKGDILLQHEGSILPGAEPFIEKVIGPTSVKLSRIRSAYPCYTLGHFWPYMVFHHGHLLDDLVLGQKSEIEYLALKAATGATRPEINLNEDLSLAHLHAKTDSFITQVWETSSKAREIEWAILRRGHNHPRCVYYPKSQSVPALKLVETNEPQGQGLGHRLTWFLNLLLSDPSTPPPLGKLDYPGYFFIGHDHSGGFKNISTMDGHEWRVINSGGFTVDDGSTDKDVHGHITVWAKEAIAPIVHCVKI